MGRIGLAHALGLSHRVLGKPFPAVQMGYEDAGKDQSLYGREAELERNILGMWDFLDLVTWRSAVW